MDNEKLNSIFQYVHKNQFPNRLRRVKAEFYPYRSLRHSVEWNGIRIKAKVSALLQNAPVQIIESLAVMLLARVYKQKVTREIRTKYREFASQLVYRRPTRNIKYHAVGEYFDLQEIFDRLNHLYFQDEIKLNSLGWSTRPSYTRLGFYDHYRKLIVISRIFDSAKAPKQVVEYLMYHEMLHIRHPEQIVAGRRRIHTREFRQSERIFPAYDDLQKWLKKNVVKL